MSKDLIQRQVSVSPNLIERIYDYVDDQGILLREFFEHMITHFERFRAKVLKSGHSVAYLFATRQGKSLNIQLTVQNYEKLGELAEEDHVSVRSLMYTALMIYAKKLHLIDKGELEYVD